VGACGRRPLWSFISFIFSYLLLFIWPLPCPARPALPCSARQTGETNTEGETPMRFFSSPWKFRLPGWTICPSLRLENSVCHVEQSVRPSFAGPLKCGIVRLSGPVLPRQLKRGTVVGWTDRRTDRQTHCCNYIRDVGTSAPRVTNWLRKFNDMLVLALGPIQGHKVQHLSITWGRLKRFFLFQPWLLV